VQHWNVKELTTPDGSRSPEILHSQVGESRVVAIHLQAGQELGDHQVKEAALLVVVDGAVRVLRFEPDERHSVAAAGEARVLLVLAPWPGEGHYRGDASVSSSAA
jgi:hypothetical protein